MSDAPSSGTPARALVSSQLALEQMLRGLDRQAGVLSELRQRANIVLSASGLIASLLGSAALDGRYSHVLALLALGSTALGIVMCISVLWRVRDEGKLPVEVDGQLTDGGRQWKVTLSGRELKELAGRPVDDVIEQLAIARRVNHRTLKKRSHRFLLACWLLLAQVVLWASVFFERTW